MSLRSTGGPIRILSASSSGSSGMPPKIPTTAFRKAVWRPDEDGKNKGVRLDRFTEKAQEALQEAAELARHAGNQAVEPEHLLLALVTQNEGVARTLLERGGASVQALQPALVSAIERFPKVSGAGQPYLGESLGKSLEEAEHEAERLKDEYVSTEHLLLALTENPALKDTGLTHDTLLHALRLVRGHQR